MRCGLAAAQDQTVRRLAVHPCPAGLGVGRAHLDVVHADLPRVARRLAHQPPAL